MCPEKRRRGIFSCPPVCLALTHYIPQCNTFTKTSFWIISQNWKFSRIYRDSRGFEAMLLYGICHFVRYWRDNRQSPTRLAFPFLLAFPGSHFITWTWPTKKSPQLFFTKAMYLTLHRLRFSVIWLRDQNIEFLAPFISDIWILKFHEMVQDGYLPSGTVLWLRHINFQSDFRSVSVSFVTQKGDESSKIAIIIFLFLGYLSEITS